MSHISTYLTFDGRAEDALRFYCSVFDTEPEGPVMRIGDMPPESGGPEVTEAEKSRVMHARARIAGGHVLMFSDTVPSMGHVLNVGDNFAISVEADSREHADALYARLSDGATDISGMSDMFWGYWGSCRDRFGVNWQVNLMNPMD